MPAIALYSDNRQRTAHARPTHAGQGAVDMTTQHTPGPWKATPKVASDGRTYNTIAVRSPQGIVCTVPDGQFMDEVRNQAANAALIAAAPELLEALKNARDGDSCWCHKTANHEPFCIKASAAIAKATGGAQ